MLNKLQAKELGKRLADLRKAKDLSQEEVGEMLGVSKSHIMWIETGRNVYKFTHDRVAVKPLLDLYGASEDEVFDGIYDIADDRNDIVKGLTERIEQLKAENTQLAQRADMWKARVEEIKADKQTVSLTVDHVEYERQQDRIRALEDKIRELEKNQKTPMEKLVLAMLAEKYA